MLTSAAAVPAAKAQTAVNLSSLEIVLSDPGNYDAVNYALWTSFYTQLYEYSMPFIELSVDDADLAVTQIEMTIGDVAFNFDDEFKNVQHTNSTATDQPGGYALIGWSSSNDVGYSSSIADGGDKLILDFSADPLQPGETVRWQIDIASDDPDGEMFPSYTSVLFDANAEPEDITDNAVFTLTYADGSTASLTLPDFQIDESTLPNPNAPRAYGVMQMIDPVPPTGFEEVIPEPTSAVLALAGLACFVGRRGR